LKLYSTCTSVQHFLYMNLHTWCTLYLLHVLAGNLPYLQYNIHYAQCKNIHDYNAQVYIPILPNMLLYCCVWLLRYSTLYCRHILVFTTHIGLVRVNVATPEIRIHFTIYQLQTTTEQPSTCTFQSHQPKHIVAHGMEYYCIISWATCLYTCHCTSKKVFFCSQSLFTIILHPGLDNIIPVSELIWY
jgi:hypothetical protein